MAASSSPDAESSASPLRIFIVDDVATVRAGLRALLSLVPGIEIVGEAADGAEALQKISAAPPDVVLMDIEMPGMDGLQATRRLRGQGLEVPIVVFSVAFDRREDALSAGADALVHKGAPVARLMSSLESFRGPRGARHSKSITGANPPIKILELEFSQGIFRSLPATSRT